MLTDLDESDTGVLLGMTHVWPKQLAQAASATAIVVYVVQALIRLRYPYPLEFLEGGSAEHVRRLLTGRTIYPAPSVDFVSYTYPPLYFWLCALVGLVTGPGLLPLRLVSVGASFGSLGVLWRNGGLPAAGVFAAAYAATGRWYDVGRVDSLYVFLLLCFVVAAARATSTRAGATSGLLLFLAALTKQTALVAALPVLGYLFIKRPRVGAATLAALAGPWLAISLILNAASGGWYRYATTDIFAGHAIEHAQVVGFWTHDLLRQLAPALVVATFAARRHPVQAFAAIGAIGSSYLLRLHSGGSVNALIPMFATLALLMGSSGAKWRRLGYVLVVTQLGLLAYRPALPHGDLPDGASHARLVAAIRATPGEVLVVAEPYDAVLGGKAGSAQAAAIADVLRSHDAHAKQLLLDSVSDGVRRRRWSAIVLIRARDRQAFPTDLDTYYRREPTTAPGVWWVPRP